MNTLLAGANPDPLARLTYVEMLLRRGEVDEATIAHAVAGQC